MLDKLIVIFGLLWLALIITQTFINEYYLFTFAQLSFCAMLIVMGISAYKKDPDAFLPYWYFIFSGITLAIAFLTFFMVL
ncbi:hypothetical protein [Alkalihalobacillus sp. LMS39]|uniref:hypothetical protein n=1 Tax=Alkalihalobacillus sp. LMS39 TaxID=2924032 RepID=UPI001FB3D6C3|nr:hypothetical protein [Alkalihalobacillus sp. LMS39]UOE95196.1 hypothetical protein MM271_06115 [Alkalihalobacillus sp. LMS39]